MQMLLDMEMESSLRLSFGEYIVIMLLRPLLAIGFVLSLISLGWLLAWKLVLVHVPLVQEVFGLKKKPVRTKPQTGRLSKIYSSIHAQNSSST
ncbi:uncharacterized protein LOC113847929 isoform X2 [Abrus precatorius]|uniref:Uncharacterized protein LOC113847929 isoform X1 n=1 Tax=Abrus precatorius TaxID=3816 RepID=A0A8B8JR74_ABRPR|nr:uncharacterized protein LOC113847929 isoform X1 [Abrus precatorius]XP_027333064.1 uncharacterized protein LOC113847929 isoform X2 [Abrus precatorius]